MKIKQKGFSLIEVLVVVGIIAVLAIAVVYALNPGQFFAQGADANRVAGIGTLDKAVSLYYSDAMNTPSTLFMGTSSVVYISIPDPTATTTAGTNCSGLGLVSTASTTYHCAAPSNYLKVDGTGWVPINFTAYPGGSPVSSLPVDPTNTTSSNEYYVYVTDGMGGYELMAQPASAKDASDTADFVRGTNLALVTSFPGKSGGSGGSSFTCGSPLVDARDSQSYATVQIGTQCWMQQNLNVGTEILGATNQGTNVSSASSIQKYCYSNNPSNCTSQGGLYQWTQAVGGSTGCDGTGASQPACTVPIQGVCPANWHIPSHYEWTELELATCTSETCATDFPYNETTTGARGTNEGTILQSSTGLFRAQLAGGNIGGSFFNQSSYAYFWSSLVTDGSAWYRTLYAGYGAINRLTNDETPGFSVRCVHN